MLTETSRASLTDIVLLEPAPSSGLSQAETDELQRGPAVSGPHGAADGAGRASVLRPGGAEDLQADRQGGQ